MYGMSARMIAALEILVVLVFISMSPFFYLLAVRGFRINKDISRHHITGFVYEK